MMLKSIMLKYVLSGKKIMQKYSILNSLHYFECKSHVIKLNLVSEKLENFCSEETRILCLKYHISINIIKSIT